jgi:hypothetical protein
MSFFSDLFKKSSFFASEYTDKSIMSLVEVMNAHANWKSRLSQFIAGTLPYKLDPDMLAEADDTELGRWILQSDSLKMSAEKKELIKQLHNANTELHQAASAIARHMLENKQAEIAQANEKILSASRKIMLLFRELGKEN